MQEFFTEFSPLLLKGVLDTLYMSGFSTLFAYAIGLPMGVVLYVTKPGGIVQNSGFYSVFSWVINILRSIPFIILIITLMPFTRIIAGKAIGATAAIIPLVIGSAPFVARMVETSLEEIDTGVVEACQCMGASTWQIITRVLVFESLPSIIRGLSITTITLIGYSALAGAVGAGGLGDIAIRYGYHRGIENVMYATVVLLILLVCIIQSVFTLVAKRVDKRI